MDSEDEKVTLLHWDLYEDLEIPRDASESDIRKAYHRQAKKYHPDKSIGLEAEQKAENEEMFKRCQQAYEVLSDPWHRNAYDDFLDLHLDADPEPEPSSGATACPPFAATRQTPSQAAAETSEEGLFEFPVKLPRRNMICRVLRLVGGSFVLAFILILALAIIIQAHDKYRYSTSPKPIGHYDVLGVHLDATDAEIKRAHRRLTRLYHPDKATGEDAKEATHKMAQLNEAYEVLLSSKRCEYDWSEMGGTAPKLVRCRDRFFELERQRLREQRLEEARLENEEGRQQERERPRREERVNTGSFLMPGLSALALVPSLHESSRVLKIAVLGYYTMCYHSVPLRLVLAIAGLYFGVDLCL